MRPGVCREQLEQLEIVAFVEIVAFAVLEIVAFAFLEL
jgi:hypothetical protein